MILEINTSDKTQIEWDAKGNDRTIQNVANLLSTFKYEVAYDRTLGLSGKFVDKPLDQAIAEATTEIIDLINEREPNANVTEVEYTGNDENGNMQFKVVIDIG